MYSFYGGKQGRTYNIVASFDSIDSMVDAFKDGGSYTEVNYGQYVIIDTINKKSLQNGCLFRRGFNYNQEKTNRPPKPTGQITEEALNEYKQKYQNWYKNGVGAGAIYIGRIVGPQGNVPGIDLISWDEYLNIDETGSTDESEYIKIKDTIQNISSHYGVMQETSEDETHYEFYDDIQVGAINTTNSITNDISSQLAFDIPKPVIEVTSSVIDPYDINTIELENSKGLETDTYQVKGFLYEGDTTQEEIETNLVHLHKYTGGTQHPFYYHYNVAIPKGIKGNSITKVSVKKGQQLTGIQVDNLNQPIKPNVDYDVYTVSNYDNYETEETFYVFPHNIISEGLRVYGPVEIEDLITNGVYYNGLPISYTDDTGSILSGYYGWITSLKTEDSGETQFYAFDYIAYQTDSSTPPYSLGEGTNNTFWYKLSGMSLSPKTVYTISKDTGFTEPEVGNDTLLTDGLWFVVQSGHQH